MRESTDEGQEKEQARQPVEDLGPAVATRHIRRRGPAASCGKSFMPGEESESSPPSPEGEDGEKGGRRRYREKVSGAARSQKAQGERASRQEKD